jgi:hypothetical protein
LDLGALQHGDVRRSIATDWRGSENGEKEGPGEGSAGLDGEGLKGRGSYWRGSNSPAVSIARREREKLGEKREPTSGTHLAARGREGKEGGWLPGLARQDLGPGCSPGWAGLFFLYFFLLFSFSFVSDFCFGFLKMLN